MAKLTRLSREDNQKATEILQKNRVQIIAPPSSDRLQEYYLIGKRARQMLVGKLYTAEFLARVEKAILDFRTHPRHSK